MNDPDPSTRAGFNGWVSAVDGGFTTYARYLVCTRRQALLVFRHVISHH